MLLGTKHGQGVMKFVNGDTYKGDWVKDKRNGYGIFNNRINGKYNDYIYKGLFVNNNKEGFGVMIYSEGDVFEGTWVDNKRNGLGMFN